MLLGVAVLLVILAINCFYPWIEAGAYLFALTTLVGCQTATMALSAYNKEKAAMGGTKYG